MTSRNARIAMELIRIARSLSLKGVLEYGIIMGGMLQSVVDVLVGDRHVVQVDLDVLLDGVDSHGREYKSRDDSTVLKGVSFVDEYRGAQIPEGKKSVTMRLLMGSDKKTLTSEEIEQCAKTVTKFLSKNLNAENRF